MDMHPVGLTVFQGRVGDHNDRAMSGVQVIGAILSDRLGLPAHVVGTPAPALDTDWEEQLEAGRTDLQAMGKRYEEVLAAGQVPVTALTRCAVALATLPLIASHHPDAVVVWFDAHADINTPDNTRTGYLGGLALSGPMGWWHSGLGASLGADRVILIGARDLDVAEQRKVDDGTIVLVAPGVDLLRRLREVVAGRPVYVHIDCDVLEPGTVPTDYHVPGGLTLANLRAAAAVLAESELVGLEVAEFESSDNPGRDEEQAAALLDALRPLLGGA